ncbi:NADH-quinone oxidoreductase subunit N [Streptomyces sp. BI20]|uniref:NADH-quinone oxidoreductase subunit N n=1 Tax=Streptomyces sp. BI20 TaxID=3403460 RepID=UPI003C716156
MTAPAHALAAADPGSLTQSVDWLALAPALLPAALALVVLVADLFLPARRKPLLGVASVLGLAAALLALLPLRAGDRATFCLTGPGTGTGPGAPPACSYAVDSLTLAVQLLVLGAALVTALLSIATVRERRLPAGEYWFLLLSATAGAALMPAARDLITLIVALEVASLPAFALVGLRRGSRLSAEAALKFFLTSVTATAVTLLGVSFVYATTGAVHLDRVADGLDAVPAGLETLASVGVGLTLVGFAFKTAAVPFHFWVPDTYVGAPLPVAGYLSVVGKAVGLTGLILVTVHAFPGRADVWGPVLAVLAALTTTLGNAAAVRQDPDRAHSAVRLLAWSSVAQAGFLLVPIAAAAYGDRDAIGATLAYALMYAAVNLGAFAVLTLTAADRPGGRLADLRGLYHRRPVPALALAFFLLCLAGLPPGVIGLFAKVAVVRTAVDAGLGWLAVLLAVNVVVGLYYYLRWTALLFTRTPDTAPDPSPDTVAEPAPAATPAAAPAPSPRTPWPTALALAVTTGTALVLSAAPQLVLRLLDTHLAP